MTNPAGSYQSIGGVGMRWPRSGDDVEIRGSCASACTLIMAHIPNDKLCFGEAAALKFHSARLVPSGEPDIATTQWMISQYPQDIRLWIKNKGGWEKMTLVQAWTLTAPELWAMGYRKCAPEPPPVPMTTKSKARATEEEERRGTKRLRRLGANIKRPSRVGTNPASTSVTKRNSTSLFLMPHSEGGAKSDRN